MSRIFDTISPATGPIVILGTSGNSAFRVTKISSKGLNQVVVPSPLDKSVEESISILGASYTDSNSSLSSVVISEPLVTHHVGPRSDDLIVVVAQVNGYVDLVNTHNASQIAKLTPRSGLVNSNKATYFTRFQATCPRTSFVEVQLDSGDKLELRGGYEYHSRDRASLSFSVKLPAKSSLRVSYAQVLPQKESILKLLSRIQYA